MVVIVEVSISVKILLKDTDTDMKNRMWFTKWLNADSPLGSVIALYWLMSSILSILCSRVKNPFCETAPLHWTEEGVKMKNVNEPLLIMQNFFNTAQINMNVSLSSMPGITGVHTGIPG